MMYLLDTHAFLWFVFDDPRLSDRAADLIEDAGHELRLSYASIWEISIKHSLGKLKFDDPLDRFIEKHILETSLRLVTMDMRHLISVNQLPWHHRDPFDRLIAVQCQSEGLKIISNDRVFDQYGLEVAW